MIVAAISDLDGTLVDTAAANEAAYAEAFAEVGLAFAAGEYRAAFGLRFDAMMNRVAPAATTEQIRSVRSAKARVYPHHLDLAQVNDGLVALLRTLRASGLRLALATTADPRNVDAVLARYDLRELFDVVVTAADVDRGKPAPDCYLRAAELLGASPADCLVFEDSAVGVAAAESAGCRVLEVTT